MQNFSASKRRDSSIESDPDSPWRVAAIAPIAGPYDLSGTEWPEMIDGPSPNRSAYLAYLALSYVQIYGGDLSDVFLYPYDTLVPSLFDGQHAFSQSQIAQELPDPQTLFRPEFIQGVHDGTQPFASQLRENNTFQVAPHAPNLYYGQADTDVFPQNTHIAASSISPMFWCPCYVEADQKRTQSSDFKNHRSTINMKSPSHSQSQPRVPDRDRLCNRLWVFKKSVFLKTDSKWVTRNVYAV